jgi:hypothetical protein
MGKIDDRWKMRFHSGWKLFGLGTMIVGVFLLLAAFPFKRGKEPYRSY